jgi:hypothetical protein
VMIWPRIIDVQKRAESGSRCSDRHWIGSSVPALGRVHSLNTTIAHEPGYSLEDTPPVVL